MGTVWRLYHGSSHVIERPIFGQGKPYDDYGLGFYCAERADLAREWASAPDRDGFVNAYRIDTQGLDVLDLEDGTYPALSWLAVLLENRSFDISSALAMEAKEYILKTFLPAYTDRDVIIGYRADDSHFSFAQDFIGGAISYGQLTRAMRLGKLGRQVVMKSRRAFERLEFIGAEPVDSSIWFGRRMLRDRAARREYLGSERTRARQKGDLYISQIIDEEMGPDDARLR